MVIFLTGQTFTLTTAIETIPATAVMAANSTISGVINGVAGSTYQSGDIINGNATSNATVIIAAANANTLATINTLQSIKFTTLAADVINAQLFSNVGTVGITGSNAVLSDLGKAGCAERTHQHLFRETATMGHKKVASLH